MLECNIECLGPHRGRLVRATQQMMNDGRNFAMLITVSENLFLKVSVVHNFCFQLQVSIVKLIVIAISCKNVSICLIIYWNILAFNL